MQVSASVRAYVHTNECFYTRLYKQGFALCSSNVATLHHHIHMYNYVSTCTYTFMLTLTEATYVPTYVYYVQKTHTHTSSASLLRCLSFSYCCASNSYFSVSSTSSLSLSSLSPSALSRFSNTFTTSGARDCTASGPN